MMLADVAADCSAGFGCGPSCPFEDTGLDGTADSGAVDGSEDEFADCWAFACNVSSNDVEITQHQLFIAHQDFGLTFVENSKATAQWPLCSLTHSPPLGES
jgi:hypothetical protein